MTNEERIDHYLDLACNAEMAGDKVQAEKYWKFAVTFEAKHNLIDSEMHRKACCPVY